MEMKSGKWLCSSCKKPLEEGYYFETDATGYCSKACLSHKMSWDEYLAIHDDGNGDAYWTSWSRSKTS
ncbi:hypothetical protein GIW82_08600 [Planomicrobium sp. YIM 101495]|nr:hypothetical protein [Planomicrobium sp. YIM 101495]